MLKPVQVYLTEEQHEALKNVAKRDGRSIRSMATVLLNKSVREAEVEMNKANG